ncbi:MAG: HAMP domain-containing sensor histidine kinase [Coriobacteriia bacterium]|nr:HAMP domain-containing sensor histidine kinase [Coriobacteriia bacterium]
MADASHELKTPLSVVMASADAISPTAKNKKYLENIKEESSRMNSLIAKLLDLASTEKTDENYLTEGNLSKTVELTALTFEAKALEKNRKISINVQDGIICKQNENDIKQLVEILLDNALEHSIEKSSINL